LKVEFWEDFCVENVVLMVGFEFKVDEIFWIFWVRIWRVTNLGIFGGRWTILIFDG